MLRVQRRGFRGREFRGRRVEGLELEHLVFRDSGFMYERGLRLWGFHGLLPFALAAWVFGLNTLAGRP